MSSKGFARYAVAATLGRLADEMVGLTVLLLVYQRTGSGVLAGLAVAGYTLPAVLTGPLLGAWLGHARRPVLALAGNELLLAVVMAALVLLLGHVPGAVVIALMALAGASLPMTSGGFSSLVPRLAGPDGLGRANTVDALTFNLSAMGGPAVGGLLASIFGPAVAVAAVAACALLAIVAVLSIPVAPGEPAGQRPDLLATARAGLAHLANTPPLRGATLASVLSLGCVGLLVVVLPRRVQGLGLPGGAAGYLWAAIEVGGALAVLLVNPRLRRFRPERVVFAAVAGYGLVLGSWTLAGTFAVLLGLAVLAGFVEGPLLPAVFAARQRYTPEPLLAQVSTTGASLKIGGYALGSAAGGLLLPAIGPVPLLLLAAAGQLLAAALGALSATPACSRPG